MKRRDKPGPWSDLFDASLVDHVCEAVRCAIVGVSIGERSMIHKPLRCDLRDPLLAYVGSHWRPPAAATEDVRAALALAERVGRLADRFEEGHPFDESVAVEVSAALRLAWLEFIAYGAGPYLYWVIPRQHAQRVNAPKGKRRGWPQYLGPADVAAVMAACRPVSTYEDRIAALCEHARRRVPSNRRPPLGEPEAAAKRAYSTWLRGLKSPI